MTFYEVIIHVENSTGVATGMHTLMQAIHLLERSDAPHSTNCDECNRGKSGTLYHTILLTQESYSDLITALEFK